jgi:hypothetical protein
MAANELNKVFNHRNYNFNISVKLNETAERHPGGKVTHLITINDLGCTNYYQKYECTSETLVGKIQLAEMNAKQWVTERENQGKSADQLVLEGLGFH